MQHGDKKTLAIEYEFSFMLKYSFFIWCSTYEVQFVLGIKKHSKFDWKYFIYRHFCFNAVKMIIGAAEAD